MINQLILILLPALCSVESAFNPAAVGDNGKAVGILQIHKEVIIDVNTRCGRRFKLTDRLDSEKSKTIASLYLCYWGLHYTKKTGKKITLEVLAKIWAGGPQGWSKKATDEYWEKVKRALKEL